MRSRPVSIAAAVVLLGTASACGTAHKADNAVHAAAAVAKAVQSAPPAGSEGAVSGVSLRVVNMFSSSRTPGGPLDIYDVPLNNPNVQTKPVPIISNVAYGAFSDYVHPHLLGALTKAIELEALPAGSDPVADGSQAQGIGGLLDDGSGAQATIELEGPSDTDTLLPGPLAGLSDSMIMEKGDDGQGGKGPAAPPVSGGGAEVLASTAPAQQMIPGAGGYDLFVDSSCAPPLNGDPNIKDLPYIFPADGVPPVSSFAVFATTAAVHHLTVVFDNSSTAPKCSDLGPKQGDADVTLAAGQQALVLVYGTKNSDLHLAVGPIQQ
jgi:hypothetical protein